LALDFLDDQELVLLRKLLQANALTLESKDLGEERI